MHRDTTQVRPTYRARLRMGSGWHHIDERFIGIALAEQSLQVMRYVTSKARVERRVDAADHRHQVRGKYQPDITA